MNNEQKEWIDNASYEELLRRWRFATANDSMFRGDLGEYYATVMFKKRDQLPPGEAAVISKKVGWDW
jgi:hypothetical protein